MFATQVGFTITGMFATVWNPISRQRSASMSRNTVPRKKLRVSSGRNGSVWATSFAAEAISKRFWLKHTRTLIPKNWPYAAIAASQKLSHV